VRAADLDDGDARPKWLVESLWARAGVGILGGAPKCCKSWLALDIALSVATKTPALDLFDVDEPGAILLYMAEDAAAVVKERLNGLCAHRGLRLEDAPIHVITAPALRLDRDGDRLRLRDAVARFKPKLLLLDPFVRLHRIDENDAGQVAELLGYLRELQRAHDLAVLVVHHARKNGSASHPGQSLRGSSDLHAWGDSNLYVRRTKDILTLTVEHRAAAARDPLSLRLVTEGTTPHLALAAAPDDDDTPEPELTRRVLALLRDAAGPLDRSALRDALRVRNDRLGPVLTALRDAGRLLRVDGGWAVPVPTP
jgi:hypothetical protein